MCVGMSNPDFDEGNGKEDFTGKIPKGGNVGIGLTIYSTR